MRRIGRAAAWAAVAFLFLLGGLAALGFGLVTLHPSAGGAASGGAVQRAALTALVETLARQALMPHAALTLAAWLALVRVVPRVDASRRSLAASLPLCALASFPVVAFTFEAWSPRGPTDVIGTAALLSGAVALGLWLARLVPGLGPGAFGAATR